jgi:phosphatidylinositol alpha-mannosyltransferase
MKIAIVTQSYHPRPGGVSEHAFYTAAELRRMGHEVVIITSHFGKGTSAESDVIRLGRNMLVPMNGAWVNVTAGLRLGAQLGKIFSEMKPEIIHTHCPLVPSLPLLTLLNAPPDSKVVGTFHAAAESNYAYRLLRGPLGRLALRMNARIAVSVAALNLAKKYFPGEYSVIPNGIDYTVFTPTARPFERYRDGAINILFVGRFDRRKGLRYLFKAVSRLSKTTAEKIRLLVVGENSIRRILLPHLDPRVEIVFAGAVSRKTLARYYTTADVFCSPAICNESFGIVLLEAMASGVPVVGTEIPGYMTLLKDRWNALVVPPRDSQALCSAILELTENQNLRWSITANGLEFVRQYSWSKVATELERLYISTVAPGQQLLSGIQKPENSPIWA